MNTKFYKSLINAFLKNQTGFSNQKDEKGSAMVIALLILSLLAAFLTLAIAKTNSETISGANDTSETRAFLAGQASLEIMTRNFTKIFDEKLSPTPADLNTKVIAKQPDGFTSEFTFDQDIKQVAQPKSVLMTGGLYQGLYALRDEWRLTSTATDKTFGGEVQLQRNFFNNLIPIFQFGMFYNDDLEVHPGPKFNFGGRVHTNGNLFTMSGKGMYYDSRVSISGHVITDVAKNGQAATRWGDKNYIKNGSVKDIQLDYAMGSATANSALADGSALFAGNPDMPILFKNKNWSSIKELFDGNLLTEQKKLELPLKVASKINGKELDYIELIKRGKNIGDLYQPDGGALTAVTDATKDTLITRKGRYSNKEGIRISMADSKAKLPGCAASTGAAVAGVCGIRLDGNAAGDGGEPGINEARGYKPLPMYETTGGTKTANYQATRVNGDRLYIAGREVWIKVELVSIDQATSEVVAVDKTSDFLSFGVTEQAPAGIIKDAPTGLSLPSNPKSGQTYKEDALNSGSPSDYDSKDTDSRSIIRLQRFMMAGSFASNAANDFTTEADLNGSRYTFINADERNLQTSKETKNCIEFDKKGSCKKYESVWTVETASFTAVDNAAGAIVDQYDNNKQYAYLGSSTKIQRIVPFPIQMFDTREGLYQATKAVADSYGNKVPMNGVMSLVDINVGNLKKFFDKEWDEMTPNGLKAADVPQANGWVLYFSDRRGDADFDGEYDMENLFTSDPAESIGGASFQAGAEDVNKNGKQDVAYDTEAPRYSNTADYAWLPEKAATIEHKYYRRGLRLSNAQTLPGIYDAANKDNTRGFTVASENGVYVNGNYNAYGVDSTGDPTPTEDYLPQGAYNIPASIAADAITVLSNQWLDSKSFKYPFSSGDRKPTTDLYLRFAMLSGDSLTTKAMDSTLTQDVGEPNLSGGVHNFKRFLETWDDARSVFYCGSLINLFNSRNNNGTWKIAGGRVYDPPTRNWVFNEAFKSPDALPPATPFFQSIQLTGFERVNE